MSKLNTILTHIDAIRSLPADGVMDTSHFDPRGNYLVLCDKLSRVHDVVCDICGTVSELSAKVLAKRASAGTHYPQKFVITNIICVNTCASASNLYIFSNV